MSTGEIKEKVNTKVVEWNIRFFGLPGKADTCIHSPDFCFKNDTWYIEIYTNGERDEDSVGWLGMHLVRKLPFNYHTVTFQLGIRKRDGSDYISEQMTWEYHGYSPVYGTSFLVPRTHLFRDRSMIENNQGIVTLFCTIDSFTEENEESISQTILTEGRDASTETIDDRTEGEESGGKKVSSYLEVKDASTETSHAYLDQADSGNPEERKFFSHLEGNCDLAKDLEKLLLDETDFDTTIKVGERKYRVHRAILGARSSVFKAMFSHDTVERSTGVAEIEDCDADAFQGFLTFLYSGKVKNLTSQNVFHLYALGDKYDVQAVKTECLNFATHSLSVDNFCDTAALAIKYNELQLLESAIAFFARNTRAVILTTNWQRFVRQYPVECIEFHIKAMEYHEQQ